MATILSQKTPFLRAISLRPTSLPHISYNSITLGVQESKRYADYSVSEYKVDYEWYDLYVEPSVPKGRTMVHPTGKRTVLKMNQRPHKQKPLYNCVCGTKYIAVIFRNPRNLSKPHTNNVITAHLRY